MSTNINKQDVMLFIRKTVGAELSAKEAKDLKIEDEYNKAVEETGDEAIKADDIAEDGDLYAQFATMYKAEKEENETKDKDKEKDEQNKVKDKNQAKA